MISARSQAGREYRVLKYGPSSIQLPAAVFEEAHSCRTVRLLRLLNARIHGGNRA